MQGRVLCKISLIWVALIAFSIYGPWDYLGVYDKASAAETYLDDGCVVIAEGVVYQKEIKKDYYLYYINDATVYTDCGKLSKTSFIFEFDSNNIPNNSKLNIKGKVSHFLKARNDGAFDMEEYYYSKGVFFQLKDVSINSCKSSGYNIGNYLMSIRDKISSLYRQYLPGEEAGFLSSVALGDRGDLENELRDLFQNAGVAHLLAVSGLHVSVVCMLVYRLLRRWGRSFAFSGLAAGIIAVIYGILTGGSISAIRAIGMFVIFLVSQVIGEYYDMLTAMSIVADILLISNPLYLKNSSFVFSFGAILVIWYVARPLILSVNSIFPKLGRTDSLTNKSWILIFCKYGIKLFSGIIFSLVIFAGMLPITAKYFHQIPIYSVLLNLLVIPLMPLLLVLGLLGGLVGLAVPIMAKYLLLPCHFIIYFFELASSIVSHLPGAATIVEERGNIAIVLYYVLLMIIANVRFNVCFLHDRNNHSPTRRKNKNTIYIRIFLIIGLMIVYTIPSKNRFEIDLLDVGQGDGIYIDSGDGARFFIDGGSTSSDKIGKYTILPFLKYKGVRAIDYWFISHTDEDHINGMLELLADGYPIKNIVFTSAIARDDKLAEIQQLAEGKGSNIIYMDVEDIVQTKHVSFKCVYPNHSLIADNKSAINSEMPEDNANDYCLSLLMEYDENLDGTVDYTAFFGGDISSEQEKIIVSSEIVGKVNLLKVNHHGSHFSSSSEFLETLSPDVAVISCSRKNSYGHPSDEAIERIKEVTDNIYYTMKSGRIRIYEGGVDLYVK